MQECKGCGAKFETLTSLDCPHCGESIVGLKSVDCSLPADKRLSIDVPDKQRMLSDSSLNVLTKAAITGIPLGATHKYVIDHTYEIRSGLRPFSVVLHGAELLVLAQGDVNVSILSCSLASGSMKMRGTFETGDGPNQIGSPAGIALDTDGTIYVLDELNCSVHKIDDSGAIVASFGGDGSEDGQLRDPRDLEVTDDGFLLADTQNNRIQKWDFDGRHLLTIGPEIDEDADEEGPPGTGPGEFDSPMGVTADSEGRIYVADTNNHRIQVFEPDGSFMREFGDEGVASGHFSFPTDVRVNEQLEIFVFDLHSQRVQKLDPAGALVYAVVFKGEGPRSEVRAIGDIDIGEDESIYLPVPGKGIVLRCKCCEK